MSIGLVLSEDRRPGRRRRHTTRRWPSGRDWWRTTRPSPCSRTTWRTATSTSARCWPGPAMRPGHGRPTARRSRSARSCLTPTPVSFSSGKNWRKVSTTCGNLLAATGDLAGAQAASTTRRWRSSEKQADVEPDVVEFQRDLATSHNNIGALLAQTGEPGRGAGLLRPGAGDPAETGGRQPQQSPSSSGTWR